MFWLIYHLPLEVVAAAIIIAVPLWAIIMQPFQSTKAIKYLNTLLAVISLAGIVYITLFRTPSERQIILMPFQSFIEAQEQKEIYRTMLMNVALFVPLGMTLPHTLASVKKPVSKTVLTAFILSLIIEIIQLVFGLGRCETDDIICNTVGAFIGALSFAIYEILYKNKTLKNHNNGSELGESEKIFLEICSSHLSGKPLEFDTLSEDEQNIIFRIASKQKLLPAVYSTLKKQDKIDAFHEPINRIKSLVLGQIASQIVKNELFLKVYSQMLSLGANPLCVKGIICRSYYPEPDQRPSSDEDLLVSKKDWQTCIQVLEKNGFSIVSQENGEMIFVNSETGCRIEMHSSPFKITTQSSRLCVEAVGDMFSDFSSIEYNGKTVLCPNADKHLLYIILHTYRHFINAGVGIRQIMDIAVFARNNDIDYARLCRKCDEAGAGQFAANIMIIANRYFGFDLNPVRNACPDFLNESIDIEPLLADILSGGIYGGGLDRRHAASVTSSEKMSFTSALFPKCSQLEGRYPCLKKHKWLLPAVWIKRAVLFALEGDSADTIKEAKRRSEIINKFVKKQ